MRHPPSQRPVFGHSSLSRKTPSSSDECVDLITTNYPYMSAQAQMTMDNAYTYSLPKNYRMNKKMGRMQGVPCDSREALLGRYPSNTSER